ncbi:MAG: metal-dependent hydrolase [Bacteroidia bacterium]|nr:metal-dependent hydrolase [Bacteroidia bacterium]MCZ2249820.1 metal-dependent hydrolase [Bacteroidia bacterium]
MQITYYGHSCFEAVLGGKKILFDPFVSDNELAKNIDINNIKPDYILISHGHYDHVADTVSIAKQSGAKVIANFEIVQWLNKQGVENTHPMNTGGKWIFDFGKVKCVSAVHSSSLPDGSYGGTAMGFIIESQDANFYYSGDTALTYDMKLIGEFRTLDFAFLCIGDNFTMSVDNALIAADFIKCNKIIGMHYDTFGYIKINHEEAIKKFSYQGKELVLMKIGETINYK